MAGPPPLSIVVPAYNEAENLPELLERIDTARGQEDWQTIVVDDGSTDRTAELLREAARGRPWLRVVRLRRNFGKSGALAAGFARARGPVVVTLDADLQDDPSEIPRLVAPIVAGEADLVLGWRQSRRDSWRRVAASKVFNGLVTMFSRVRFRDINSGLKVMCREVIEEIELFAGYHRFLPLLAHSLGFRIAEIPVAHHPRGAGRSRYGTGRYLRGLFDLVALRFLARYRQRPGRFFAGVGLGLFVAGGAFGAYLVGLRLVTGSIQSRYPLLVLAAFLLVAGIHFVAVGLLGELIAESFHRGRSAYSVREEWGGEDSSCSEY